MFRLPSFNTGSKETLSTSDILEITDEGREAVNAQRYGGDKHQILIRLEIGACSIKDLCRYTGLPYDRVRTQSISLLNHGEVQKMERRF